MNSPLDKNILTSKSDATLSMFSFLFSEIVNYCRYNATDVQDVDASLHRMGYDIGRKHLEILSLRDSKPSRRDRSPLAVLQYLHTHFWKSLTGQIASGLEKSAENANEYFLLDNNPITNRFISPDETNGIQCASFMAGIINGALDAQCMFSRVTASITHTGIVYVIQFISLPV